ncbi:hypothetical protein D3C81_1877140 [compost metagenome]
MRRKDPLLKRAILEIAAEQTVQGQQYRQQRCNPHEARRKGLQHLAFRPHRQREQGDDDGEEHQRVGQLRRPTEQ